MGDPGAEPGPPAEVRGAAAGLGALRSVRHLVTPGFYAWAVAGIAGAGLAGLAAIGWLMGRTPESWFRFVLASFGLALLAGAGWLAAVGVRRALVVGPVDLYEYDLGLIRSSRLDTAAFPWSAVVLIEHVYRETAGGPTRRVFSLRRFDEAGRSTEPLLLHGDVERISARIIEAALPDALAAARSPAGITFGPLTLGPDGVSHGGETTPWSRLDRVVREGDEVRVYRDGRDEPWLRAPIGAVPGAPVLLAVAERLLADFRPA
jgi:hypothetical protein